MRSNDIHDRGALVRQNIGVGQTTIYRTFAEDWSGTVSFQVLSALSQWAGVRLADLIDRLVDDPVRPTDPAKAA